MNSSLRKQFPALSRQHQGKPLVFLDGPAGVQVPQSVIDAISAYYQTSNANSHGHFVTTQETDEVLEQTRKDLAVFLGAEGRHTISFGQNMTTLNFQLARALGRILQPGDEVLITQLDHEANRGPWLGLREQGILVKEIPLLPSGILDYEEAERLMNERTRLVAMGLSSNILGTVNDVALMRQLSHRVGAWLLLDAVHYAPHFCLDVQQLDCDFLLCSAYKFYGPHVGILYAKAGLLDQLPIDRLRTAGQHAPYSIETGTLNHAAIAGTRAAIHFIASLGEGENLRKQLQSAYKTITDHECKLAQQLFKGLRNLPKIYVKGPDFNPKLRSPTLSFTLEGKDPVEVCQFLGEHNICAWDGHFYALRAVEVLGLNPVGGVTRMGISVYTTAEEVEYTLEVLEKLVR